MKNKQRLTLLIVLAICLAFVPFNGEPGIAIANVNSATNEQKTEESNQQASYRYAYPIICNGVKPADPIGPIGGTFTSVITDPNNANVVIGGHYEAGIFISFNQGQTWYPRSNGLTSKQIQSLAIHPRHSNILYAGTYGNGVFLSRDQGKNWIPWSGSVLNNYIVYDIEIDPTNPSNVYTASRVGGSLVGYISRSTDAGKTWQVVYRGDWFDKPDYFYNIEVHPAGINTVYFSAHEHGFFRSVDNGITFSPINNGVSDLSARGIAIHKANQDLVLGAVWKGSGVFKSTNRGTSWVQSRNGLPDAVRISKIKEAPALNFPNRFFVSTFGHGIYISENAGTNWSNRGLMGSQVNDIAISYFNPETWYLATQYQGIFKTSNGGGNWAKIMADLHLYTVTGMQVLAYDPSAIYVAIHGLGVYRYLPENEDWQAINAGLDEFTVKAMYSDGKALWATTENALWTLRSGEWIKVELPQIKISENEAFQVWEAERLGEPFVESAERLKENFEALNADLTIPEPVKVTAMTFDEEQMFIGSSHGVWEKQADGWSYLGLNDKLVFAIESVPSEKALWVSACESAVKCSVWHYQEGVWVEKSAGLANARVNGFLQTDSRLYAAAEDGIYSWNPEDESWVLVQTVKGGVLAIYQKPNSSQIILTGTKGKLITSLDSGETWQELATDKDWTYQFLAFSPSDDTKLLLGSLESGLFLMSMDQ